MKTKNEDWFPEQQANSGNENWFPEETVQSNPIKEKHPLLYKLAEKFQGSQSLEKAGMAAGDIEKAFARLGLPAAAQVLFQGGSDIIRGVGNLLPMTPGMGDVNNVDINNPLALNQQQSNVNIPNPHFEQFPREHGNPYVEKTAEIAGSLGSAPPIFKGYQALKNATGLIPYLNKLPSSVRALLSAGSAGYAASPDDRELGAGLGLAAEAVPQAARQIGSFIKQRHIGFNEEALKKAMHEFEQAKIQHDNLQQTALHEFNLNTPQRLLMMAADKTRELENIRAQSKQFSPEEINRQLPPVNSNKLLAHAEQNKSNINKQISTVLDEGLAHDEAAAKILTEMFEGKKNTETGEMEGALKQDLSKEYDSIKNDLGDQKISFPKEVDMKEIEHTVSKLSPSLPMEIKENFKKSLIKASQKSGKDIMSAKDFYTAYREVKKSSENAFNNAYKHGVSPQDHEDWIKRGQHLKEKYLQMEKILENQTKGAPVERLKKVNKRYAIEYAPLFENKMYQDFKNLGKTKRNMMEELRGMAPGNDILNNVITKHPELQRLIIGQSFAENPEKLLKPNQTATRYTSLHPEISRLMQEQQEATKAVKKAKIRNEQEDVIGAAQKLHEKETTLPVEIKRAKELAKQLAITEETKNIAKVGLESKTKPYKTAINKRENLKDKISHAALVAALGGGGYLINKRK